MEEEGALDEVDVGDSGSTWTMSSDACTIDLINDVLPDPAVCEQRISRRWTDITFVTSYKYFESS